ncbi:MAG: hypothetical protein EZS28_056643 [Streblomastix strix]|uniref:Uncharacterized protein n=1 Tax=Streblomastix strix TaxID=222440 RepID=A0A5J4PGV2_9EUKA|nr:MAG: hypothetical protein EZS28_056643 [Streblomastix strix]
MMKKMTSSGKNNDKAKDSIVNLKQQKLDEQLEVATEKAQQAVESEQSAEQQIQEASLREQELNKLVHIAYQRQQAAQLHTKLANQAASQLQNDFLIYSQKNHHHPVLRIVDQEYGQLRNRSNEAELEYIR